MRNILSCVLASSLSWWLLPIAEGQQYPEASLDQATLETIDSLRIDRYEGLGEEGLQAEYAWALGMARRCLDNPAVLRQDDMGHLAIEYQRHAGRTSRYRGFGEQAIEDYETAIDYARESARLLADTKFASDPAAWEEVILRDIAETYLVMDAYKLAAEITDLLIERVQGSCEAIDGTAPDLSQLAQIAQREGRLADSVSLLRLAIRSDQHLVGKFLEGHPDLQHIEPSLSWADVVRHLEVQHALTGPEPDDTTSLREVYGRLGRALRLNKQFDEAEYALETAQRTPWVSGGTYRENLDLYVDREWGFLALANGEAGEALAKAEFCLGEYVMGPAEEIELLDLVSRAKEALGNVDGAMEALEAAIKIVETRRANLLTDEFKQSYAAGYAELYRRALDLSMQLHKGQPEQIEETFEWSERIKGRAMLDAINRYDKRMERAIVDGNTEKMMLARRQMREVVSLGDLRAAEWWPGDTALLEFAYGADLPQSTQRARSKGQRQAIRNAERATNHEPRVYLWVVTKDRASFHRLAVSRRELDELSSGLTAALQRRDDRWTEPATKLYEHTIKPIAYRLKGLKQLVIVGDGKLRTVPFEVLVLKRDAFEDRAVPHKLFIEDYAIGYAPSATLLDVISKSARPAAWKYSLWAFASTQFGRDKSVVSTQQAPSAGKGRNVPTKTFGDVLRSARSLSLNDLPYTKNEVEQIARFFREKQAKTWINQPDMKATLLAAGKNGDLRSVRFLHFATHAIVDESRPYLAGLVLSQPYPTVTPDGGSAEISRSQMNGQVDRGIAKSKPVEQAESQKTLDRILRGDRSQWSRPELLTLHELAELDLRSELVVLSACQSIGKRHIEGDWINGLARAFLMAGSSGVLCTLWETGDLLSAAVIPAIYDVMLSEVSAPANINVPRALQQYKKSVLDSPRLGHPANWAPFIYHGKVAPRNDP